MTSENLELEQCAGYQRPPHPAPISLEFQVSDGTRTGLCRICANRWLLSEEEWPPKTNKNEAKTSTQTNSQIAT